MTPGQWERLLAAVRGETAGPPPTGFIIDSPWLPAWAGMSILDYYASDPLWLEANLKAVSRFPDTLFLPGFWAEYGMCTEPASFGARCLWHENEFPFAEPVCPTPDAAAKLQKPDPKCHGLTPYVLKRLVRHREAIEKAGHAIRFAVARGPLNIASFLMGTTEFLMAMKLEPDKTHALLKTVTGFLVDWLKLQASAIETIKGVLLLDDIVGFIGPEDLKEFAEPYLKEAFGAVDADVRFFHNDAEGTVCAPHLAGIGVNLFNFSHNHGLAEMRKLAGSRVGLLGNIPPRDVLAKGTPKEVAAAVRAARADAGNDPGLILSCGGGMPPGVTTENLEAFLAAAR